MNTSIIEQRENRICYRDYYFNYKDQDRIINI